MHGLPTIGTIGFGWFEVSGRSRVPSPPAITTAFIAITSRRALAHVRKQRGDGQREAGPEDPQRPRVPWCVTITQPTLRYSSHVARLARSMFT